MNDGEDENPSIVQFVERDVTPVLEPADACACRFGFAPYPRIDCELIEAALHALDIVDGPAPAEVFQTVQIDRQ